MDKAFPYQAVILDLDGVITETRQLHVESWKETFKDLAFSDEDYDRYVDGKPREDGVRTFLASQGVETFPEIIQRYSDLKNRLYLSELRKLGPSTYQDSLKAIKKWKQEGIRVAVVSSSRNCTEVLDAAGIKDLFDVQIDPVVAEPIHLRPKPEADYFLEAAKRLGKDPKDCVLVEDSISGIQAGVKGHFKAVIGISREGQTPEELLYREGASQVVNSLEMIGAKENALKAWEKIRSRIADREVALFLDFDGTLSDIVSDPAAAWPRPQVLSLIQCCAHSLKLSVVSGRDRQDLKKRIDQENIFFAGSHGFSISGPGGFHFELEEAKDIAPELKLAEELLVEVIKEFPGAIIEIKKFFLAIHYRKVDSTISEKLKEKVVAITEKFPHLEVREGKMVIEMAPRIKWGKGEAIQKLCEVLEIKAPLSVPLYLGDDLTDEDAFRKLKGFGIGIKVGPESIFESAADYWLKDPRKWRISFG